jgi:bifunctional non-homologous end joining protein LigD/DNA ligase-1
MTGINLPVIRPMLAVNAQPFDSKSHLFEVKWDGYRGLAYLDGGTVVRSRNLIDITGKFPELGGMHNKIKRMPAILDGEIVAFENGRPSFNALQTKGKTSGFKKNAAAGITTVFIAFDVVYSGGRPVMEMPLEERKKLLEDMVEQGEEIVISQYIFHKGRDFYKTCIKKGLEGVVAKKLTGKYLPGCRSRYWQKFRNTKEADLVICGFQYDPVGNCLISLVLGGYAEGRLVYQGKVGTGFSVREAGVLLEGLSKLETNVPSLDVPPRERHRTRWVVPLLVCSVEYLATTGTGLLRHPVFKGLRTDKTPQQCNVLL